MGLWQFRMGLNGLAGDWEASHHRESDILNLDWKKLRFLWIFRVADLRRILHPANMYTLANGNQLNY